MIPDWRARGSLANTSNAGSTPMNEPVTIVDATSRMITHSIDLDRIPDGDYRRLIMSEPQALRKKHRLKMLISTGHDRTNQSYRCEYLGPGKDTKNF